MPLFFFLSLPLHTFQQAHQSTNPHTIFSLDQVPCRCFLGCPWPKQCKHYANESLGYMLIIIKNTIQCYDSVRFFVSKYRAITCLQNRFRHESMDEFTYSCMLCREIKLFQKQNSKTWLF